jgi:hypothetical protein
MRLAQLLHVLRASAEISGEKSFVVVGSQALLLAIESPDQRLTLSDEIDLYPALAPDKADAIDGAIGALSMFHETHGYHADGVSPETAVMPTDWMGRATLHYFDDLTVICPELHDLCVSKCVAGRDKDADFVRILLQDKHVNLEILLERIAKLDPAKHPVSHITQWAQRRAQEASA